ncbi:hypothetical protein A2U01_0098675, partial [Trifolium medium]|nr:hypothetical protein [Trifolium medium]
MVQHNLRDQYDRDAQVSGCP